MTATPAPPTATETPALRFAAPTMALGPAPGLTRAVAPTPTLGPGGRFVFGVMGDTPYSPGEKARFPALVADVNGRDLAFVVHVGDLGQPADLCDDAGMFLGLGRLSTIRHPVVYTPGDNEWTDCHEIKNPTDPLDRLTRLRRAAFPNDLSLGGAALAVRRQSAEERWKLYPENAAWALGGVHFATVHVVGSNNGRGRDAAGDAEWEGRSAASVAWVGSAFAGARAADARALVLAFQADPNFDQPRPAADGFGPLLNAIGEGARAFGRPVLLVNGDSHTYRVDQPLPALPSVQRLESFGFPTSGWVQVTVDPTAAKPFVFEPRVIR